MTSSDRLSEIRKRQEAAKATMPGEWVASGNEVGEFLPPDVLEGPAITAHFDGDPGRKIADFIANAPADIDWLIEQYAALRSKLAEVRDYMDEHYVHAGYSDQTRLVAVADLLAILDGEEADRG